MASLSLLSEASNILHYSCVLAVPLLFFFSVFVNIGRIRRKRNERKWRPRTYTIFVGLLVLTYITEGVVTATEDASDVSNAHIIHDVSLALTWLVVAARQNCRVWYELWGASLTTLLFETPLFVLSSFCEPSRLKSATQMVSQAIRLLILLYLIVDVGYAWVKNQNASRNETQPLLQSTDLVHPQETNYGTEPFVEHSDLEYDSDESSDNESDESGDSDDAGRIKRFRKKRLREVGGWWRYLRDFSIFLPYLIPRKDRKVQFCIAVSVFCLVCKRILTILVPRQLGIVVDKALGMESPYGALVIWLLLRLLIEESGIGLVENLAKIPINQFSYRQITNAAFNHVMNLSMEFHSERDSAEVMKAIEQGGSLGNILEAAILDIAPTVVDMLIAFNILYWKFNVYVALAMAAASFAFVTLEVFTSSWNIENRRKTTKTAREEARVMHQAVQGWQTVSYFNMFDYERHRFDEAVSAQLAAARDWSKRDAYIQAILEALVPATFFTLACLVLYEVSQGRASVGDFVFLIQYWESLVYPLKFLSHSYRWLMSDLIDAERLLNLLQSKPTVVDKEGAEELGVVKGHVVFKHVYFAYDPRKTTIEDINISAAPGETVAFVGATGAGKSSIMKLLLRFYDITSGRIEIDGHEIRDVTLSSLRNAIGVVPQDPLLFNASIMENIRYARPDATDEEVFAACGAASIHDKITAFPDGYGTRVGEQGVKLSGGEVQRLAIARVFLKEPPILVLDEATSAVDTNTESEIQMALEGLRSRRTTFVVAHRLSTVVSADQILVMHEGKIVEKGTHQELLERDGKYKNLWTKQIGGSERI